MEDSSKKRIVDPMGATSRIVFRISIVFTHDAHVLRFCGLTATAFGSGGAASNSNIGKLQPTSCSAHYQVQGEIGDVCCR
eukprot:3836844-Rhodomonas_salina.1